MRFISITMFPSVLLPEPIDHELFLLLAHAHRKQRPDLTQRNQQVDGVLHRGGADGVRLLHGPQQFADAVILPPQQAEHDSHQLRVLDVGLLGPAGDSLRNQLLQVGWKRKENASISINSATLEDF